MQFEILIEEGLVGVVTVVATELFEQPSPSKNNSHVSNLLFNFNIIHNIKFNTSTFFI